MFKEKLILATLLSLSVSGVNANAIPVADLETFFGGAPIASLGTTDGVFNQPGFEGSGIKSSFNFMVGDVLSFDFRFLTDEHASKPNDWFNDYAVVVFDGAPSVLATVNSLSFVPSATPYIDKSPLENFSTTVNTDGMFDFGIGIVDQGDPNVNSALLIDNVVITRGTANVFQESFEGGPPDFAIGNLEVIGDFEVVGTYFGHAPTDGSMQALISTGPPEVPLPAAFWLFGSGLIGLVGMAKCKKA